MEKNRQTLLQVPAITQLRYAELTGLTIDVVRGQVSRGHLPTLKQGRYRLVNIFVLFQQAEEIS